MLRHSLSIGHSIAKHINTQLCHCRRSNVDSKEHHQQHAKQRTISNVFSSRSMILTSLRWRSSALCPSTRQRSDATVLTVARKARLHAFCLHDFFHYLQSWSVHIVHNSLLLTNRIRSTVTHLDAMCGTGCVTDRKDLKLCNFIEDHVLWNRVDTHSKIVWFSGLHAVTSTADSSLEISASTNCNCHLRDWSFVSFWDIAKNSAAVAAWVGLRRTSDAKKQSLSSLCPLYASNGHQGSVHDNRIMRDWLSSQHLCQCIPPPPPPEQTPLLHRISVHSAWRLPPAFFGQCCKVKHRTEASLSSAAGSGCPYSTCCGLVVVKFHCAGDANDRDTHGRGYLSCCCCRGSKWSIIAVWCLTPLLISLRLCRAQLSVWFAGMCISHPLHDNDTLCTVQCARTSHHVQVNLSSCHAQMDAQTDARRHNLPVYRVLRASLCSTLGRCWRSDHQTRGDRKK